MFRKRAHGGLLANAIFLAPITLILIAVIVFPLVYAFTLSTSYWNLVSGIKRFIGLSNFVSLFSDPFLYTVLKTTLIYTGSCVSIQLIGGLVLALVIEAGLKRKLKGMRMAVVILIMPMILAPVITAFFFKILYSPQLGFFNQILKIMGLNPVLWVYSPKTALLSLIIADTWQWTSFMFTILLSGLMGLPREPVEAAQIDGAGKWQIIYFIKLPLLIPVLLVALLMRTIDSIKYLDLIYVLTQGGPGSSTEILSYFTYRTGFVDFRMGLSAAIGVIELIIILLLCTLLIRTVRTRGIF